MPMKTKRPQVQIRLADEYIDRRYGNYPHQVRVRLGQTEMELDRPDLSPEDRRLLVVWRRWADAVVIKPDKAVIIEAAIIPVPGDIMELKLYERLFHETPELQLYSGLPVVLDLVYAIPDPVVLELAEQAGIRTIWFKPSWMDDYLSTVALRKRRAPRTSPNGHKERR